MSKMWPKYLCASVQAAFLVQASGNSWGTVQALLLQHDTDTPEQVFTVTFSCIFCSVPLIVALSPTDKTDQVKETKIAVTVDGA